MSELDSHIFDPHLQKFEKQIIEFFVQEGKIRNRGKRVQLIYAYLLIHRHLTQNQLAELSGLSKGFISSALASMQSIKLVNRKMIPGTHTYKYSFANGNIFFGMQESSNRIKYYNHFEDVIWDEIGKLEEIDCKNEIHKKFLKNRMKDLIRWTQAATKVICQYGKILNPNETKYPNLLNIKLDNLSNSLEYYDYEPAITQFETELIETIISLDRTYRKNPILVIEGYFLTRRILSQQKIEELSHYSRATISKSISKMLKIQEIEEIKKENFVISGYKAYIMPNITKKEFLFQISTHKQILGFYSEIKQVIEELTNDKKRIEYKKGYGEIMDIVGKLEEFFVFHAQNLEITQEIYNLIEK